MSAHRGRKPKRPETVEDGLREIIEETDKWLRRYDQAWFEEGDDAVPALELGFNEAGDRAALPELCTDAIDALAALVKRAQTAKKRLQALQKDIEK